MESRETGRGVRAGAALYAVGVFATHAGGLASRSVTGYAALLSEEPLLVTGLWLAAVACLVAAGPAVPDVGALVFGLGPLLVESYLFYHTLVPAAGGIHPAVVGGSSLAALRFAATLLLVGGALAAIYGGSSEAERDSRVPAP